MPYLRSSEDGSGWNKEDREREEESLRNCHMTLPLRQLYICVKQRASQCYSQPKEEVHVDTKKAAWPKAMDLPPFFLCLLSVWIYSHLTPPSTGQTMFLVCLCLCVWRDGDSLYLYLWVMAQSKPSSAITSWTLTVSSAVSHTLMHIQTLAADGWIFIEK